MHAQNSSLYSSSVSATDGVEYAGPFALSLNGDTTILIYIEHFTEWIEQVPLKDQTPATTAQASLSQVLARFGALGEILIDQGGEFRGKSNPLVDQHSITHKLASKEHPLSDRLDEDTQNKGFTRPC